MEKSNIKSKHWLLLLSALVLSLSFSSSVYAVATLYLTDGIHSVTVEDNVAGDQAPLLGVVTALQPVGDFIVNVSTGSSKPILPMTPGVGVETDLNSVNIFSSKAGTLIIKFSDDNFSFDPSAPSDFVFDAGGTLTAPPGSTVEFTTWYDPDNQILAETDLIASLGTFGPGAYSGSASGDIPGSDTNLFSLTTVAVINFTGPGIVSFDLDLKGSPVPEPGSILLLGFGLLGLGGWGMRRRGKK